MGDGKWVKMVDIGQERVTIQMCHIPNAWEAKKNPSMEPKTCQKGPKVGSEYWPTSKTSHCVRTACALRAHCVHGIPKKVKPACPGTQPSNSTCLTKKGWFAKKEKIKFAKWCYQWPPVFD